MSANRRKKSLASAMALTMIMSLAALIMPLSGVASAAHGVCDLDIEVENDTNPTGTTHTLTALLVEDGPSPETAAVCNDPRAEPITVDFEIDCVSGATGANYTGETGGAAENATAGNCGANDAAGAGDDIRTTPDLECVIGSNPSGSGAAADNSCTVSYSRDTDGQDEVVGWADEDDDDTTDNSDSGEAFADNDSDSTDAVAKFWSDPTQQQINCGPEGDINPVSSQHTVTCTVRSAAGANPLLEGADVDYQVTGANPTGPQHGCTTGANGTCSFTYTGNNAGNDVIQAFVNQDGNHTNNDCGAEATGDAENDDFCDQVEKTFQVRVATFLDIEPETDTNPNGSVHALVATFTDQFGDPIDLSEGQLIDFEITSGPNTNQTPNFRDFECPSNNPTTGGTCTASYTDAAAFDPNNAIDTICAWISTDGDDDQFIPAGSDPDGGDCDVETPGETEQGVDPNGANIPGLEGNDITDVVQKTYIQTQCSNGVDDDGDGLVDFGEDPSCTSASDNTEAPFDEPPECSNGVDDDGDGRIDFGQDPSCSSATDDTEAPFDAPPACSNGIDDDGDGFIDTSDPACTSAAGTSELPFNAPPPPPDPDLCSRDRPGHPQNEILLGGADADVICGYDGNDTIRGLGENDTLRGGRGDDLLRGGAGRDSMRGGPGQDVAKGGGGKDTCRTEGQASCEV